MSFHHHWVISIVEIVLWVGIRTNRAGRSLVLSRDLRLCIDDPLLYASQLRESKYLYVESV